MRPPCELSVLLSRANQRGQAALADKGVDHHEGDEDGNGHEERAPATLCLARGGAPTASNSGCPVNLLSGKRAETAQCGLSAAAIGLDGGKATLAFALPSQGVSLLVVRWP